MDILCVREATRVAAEHCRSGKVTWNIWLNKKSKIKKLVLVVIFFPLLTRAPFSWSFKPTVTMDTVWVTLVSGKKVQRCWYSRFVLIIYNLGCWNYLHTLFAFSIIVLFVCWHLSLLCYRFLLVPLSVVLTHSPSCSSADAKPSQQFRDGLNKDTNLTVMINIGIFKPRSFFILKCVH